MKFVYAAILVLLMTCPGYSQFSYHTWGTGLSWELAIPTGDTKTFADDSPSLRGLGFDFRQFRSKEFSVGFFFGWNTLFETTKEPISIEDGVVSGTQDRTINNFSLLVNVHRYFRNNDRFVPYIGANVGTYKINQRLDIGVFTVNENNWHFGFAPEIGFAVPLQSDAYVTLSVRYNYALESGLTPDQSFFGIKLGLLYF